MEWCIYYNERTGKLECVNVWGQNALLVDGTVLKGMQGTKAEAQAALEEARKKHNLKK